MNITSVLVLLQLVVALLSNPQTAQNPQTSVLVGQAMSAAKQVLAEMQTQPVTQPVVQTSQPSTVGAPVVETFPVVVKPTCSLTATLTQEGLDTGSNYNVEINWNAQSKGKLYQVVGNEGGMKIYSEYKALKTSGTEKFVRYSPHYKAVFEDGSVCETDLVDFRNK